jgi:hypothetical protein
MKRSHWFVMAAFLWLFCSGIVPEGNALLRRRCQNTTVITLALTDADVFEIKARFRLNERTSSMFMAVAEDAVRAVGGKMVVSVGGTSAVAPSVRPFVVKLPLPSASDGWSIDAKAVTTPAERVLAHTNTQTITLRTITPTVAVGTSVVGLVSGVFDVGVGTGPCTGFNREASKKEDSSRSDRHSDLHD